MAITPDQLAERIAAVLQSRESCPIFGQTIKEVWPREGASGSQTDVILEFSKAHGFEAQLTDPGVMVTFRLAK